MKALTVVSIILITLLILDAAITTPYALTHIPNVNEGNPLGRAGYEAYGIKYFFMDAFLNVFATLFMLQGMQFFGEKVYHHYTNKGKKISKSLLHLPLFFAIPMSALLSFTVYNNMAIIIKFWMTGQ